MFTEFFRAHLPNWAQVVPGKEYEVVSDLVGEISQDHLLDEVLNWINHPERVTVRVLRDGGIFRLSASYDGTEYEAVAVIKGTGLKYIKPWEDARKPHAPLFGVKMVLRNNFGGPQILLTGVPEDVPSEYDIKMWGREGTLYEGVVFENIPGGPVLWKEGETREEFIGRALKEFSDRVPGSWFRDSNAAVKVSLAK